MPSTIQKKYRNPNITTAGAVLVGAGNFTLVGWNLINSGTSNAYLKLYNSATAGGVTVGSTVPVKTLLLPGSGTCFLSNEDKFQDEYPLGLVIAVTGGMLDSDSSAPSGACYVELLYSANI